MEIGPCIDVDNNVSHVKRSADAPNNIGDVDIYEK
jgi:hypothetical protein